MVSFWKIPKFEGSFCLSENGCDRIIWIILKYSAVQFFLPTEFIVSKQLETIVYYTETGRNSVLTVIRNI